MGTRGSLLLPLTRVRPLPHASSGKNASLEHRAHSRFPGAWRPLWQYWEHGAPHMSLEQGAQFLGSLGQGAHSCATWGTGARLLLRGHRCTHSCFTRAQCPSYLPQAKRPLMPSRGTWPTTALLGHDAHSGFGWEAAPPIRASNTHSCAPVGRLSKPPTTTAATKHVHPGCNLLAHCD